MAAARGRCRPWSLPIFIIRRMETRFTCSRCPTRSRRAALLLRAVQHVRQELSHQIETGGCAEGDAGIPADVPDALPTVRSPNAGDRACTHDAGDAGNGKGGPAIRMLGCDRAADRVSRSCPEAVSMGGKVSIVFVKKDGGSVGDSPAYAVVRQIASKALSIRSPTLSPLLGTVLPLADPGAGSLGQKWNRPDRAHKVQVKPSSFREGGFIRTYHAHDCVDEVLLGHGGGLFDC